MWKSVTFQTERFVFHKVAYVLFERSLCVKIYDAVLVGQAEYSFVLGERLTLVCRAVNDIYE